jgi:hypothetical protein
MEVETMSSVSDPPVSGKTYPKGVYFTIECLPSDIPIRGNFVATEDPDRDRRDEDQVIADSEWNEWAWCTVKVTAHFGDFEGTDVLGGCNYRDEEDFKAPGGYWEDMKAEAFLDLTVVFEGAAAAFRALQSGGAQ